LPSHNEPTPSGSPTLVSRSHKAPTSPPTSEDPGLFRRMF
jgi:hypothetical protein